jgi:hypothetical protein
MQCVMWCDGMCKWSDVMQCVMWCDGMCKWSEAFFGFLLVSCDVVFPTDRNDSHLKWESCLWLVNTKKH